MSGEDPIITEDACGKRDAYAARRVSTNFSVAKGGAALIVMAGHIGTGIPDYWVVVTVGLLVFSISSGYFTWLSYHGNFQWQCFWRRKVARLIPNLFVIELFLFVLFLAQGREGLWSWHTVLNLAGLSGFLNWFHIPNQSPYGAGMWFLTLLLIFYAVYPLLERHYRRIGSFAATAGGILCLFALHHTVVYGHALWLTAAGFLVGIFLSSRQIRLPAVASAGMAAATAIGMIISHAIFKFDAANFFFILTIAAGGILCLFEIELPEIVTHVGGWLSAILLEIYLLHPYLQVNLTGIYRLNQAISVAIVLFVAWLLARLAKQVRRYGVQWLQ